MPLSEADLTQKLRAIRLVSFDVDGVLTDGSITFSESGEVFRTFNVKDGLGLQRLQDSGVVVAIISAGTTTSITERFTRLGIKHVHIGVLDKLQKLKDLAAEYDVPLEACAHMGDDLNDLKLMRATGLGIAPQDAVDAVLAEAEWIVPKNGGRAAARHVSDRLIALQADQEEAAGTVGHLET
ncbi:MAG: KdsC family phosphatase [Magnetovibrionaceae bacterium]